MTSCTSHLFARLVHMSSSFIKYWSLREMVLKDFERLMDLLRAAPADASC